MTHDELLARVNDVIKIYETIVGNPSYLLALRAVVELHKPYAPNFAEVNVKRDGGGTCLHCSILAGNSLSVRHPCSTIQAIEKELSK